MALITKDFNVKSGLIVQGTAAVFTATNNTGALQVNSGFAVSKNMVVASTATIYGVTTIYADTTLTEKLSVGGDINVNNNNFTIAASDGSVHTQGAMGVRGTFNSTGTLTVNTDKFTVDASNGNTHAEGNMGVRGTFNSTGTLTVNTDKFTVTAASGDTSVAGTLHSGGNFDVATTMFTVNSTNGNTAVDGTLAAKGNFSVNTNKFTVDAANGSTAVLGDLAVNTDRFTVNSSTGNTSVLGTLHSGGSFDVATDKFTVDSTSGNTAVKGDFAVNTNKFTVTASNGNTAVDGTFDAKGNLAVNTSKFTVDASSGNVHAEGNMGVRGTFNSTGTLTVNDNFTVTASNGNVETDGTVKINNTGSNLATAGDNSFYTEGGAHIAKDLKVGQDVVIAGNLTVQGVQTIVDSTVTNISDPVIELGTGPNGAALGGDDGLNRGIALHYYNTATSSDKQMFVGRANDSGYFTAVYGTGDVSGSLAAFDYATFDIGSIFVRDNTYSTSTANTNALDLLGGFSVAGDSYIDADLNVTGKIYGTAAQADNLNGGGAGYIPIQDAAGHTSFIPAGTLDNQVLTWNLAGTTATWISAAGTEVGRATTATNVDGPQWSVLYQRDVGLTTATSDLQYNADDETFKVNNVTVYADGANGGGNPGDADNTIAVPAGQSIELYSATTAGVSGTSQLNHDGEIFVKAGEVGASLEVTGATFILNTLTNAILDGTGYLQAPYVRPDNLATTGGVVFSDNNGNLVDDGGLTFDSGTEKLTVGGSIEVSGSGGDIVMTGGDITGVSSIDMSSHNGTLTVGSTGTVKFAQLDRYGIAFINTVDGEVETVAGLKWGATADTLEATNIRTGGTLSIGSTGTVKLAQLTDGVTFGGVPYISAVDGTVSTDRTHFSYDDVADKLSIANVKVEGSGAAADATPALHVNAGGAYINKDLKVDSTNATNSGTDVAAVTVAGGAKIGKDLYVDSTATIMGGLFVDDDVTINADLYVEGTIYVKGASLDGVDQISGSTGTFADVRSTGTIFANVITATTLTVTGTAVINNLTLESATLTDLTVTGTTNLNGLTSTGTVYITNDADRGYGFGQSSTATNDWSVGTAGGIRAHKNITAGGVVSAGDNATDGNDTGVVDAFYAVNNMQAVRTIISVGNGATTIDSWDKLTYTSAKYIVQIVDRGNVHTQEMMVIHNGSNVYVTEYGIITDAGDLGTFGGGYVGGTNVEITFTPTNSSGDMVIQVVRQSILTNVEDFC